MKTIGGIALRSAGIGLWVTLSVLGTGCGRFHAPQMPWAKAKPEQVGKISWFPLEVGNEWVYQFKDFNTPGGKGDYQFRLVSRGELDVPALNRKAFVVDEISPQGKHPTAYFIEKGYLIKVLGLGYDADGSINWDGKRVLKEFGFNGVGNTQKVMPVSLKVGFAWDEDTQILNAAVNVKNKIASKEAVDTPAGHFDNVLRLDSSMSVKPAKKSDMPGGFPADAGDEAAYSYSDWYADGIGLVRSFVKLEDGTPAADTVLLDVHSAGDAANQHADSGTHHNG